MSASTPVALTIAGFDPSSGAGVTADLSVFAAHGLYGTSTVTVMTVQSTLGVAATQETNPDFLDHTLRHLVADLPPDGVKIGALGSGALAAALAQVIEPAGEHGRPNRFIPIVFDPVLVSSSGRELFRTTDLDVLHDCLLPRVSWITPNWNELGMLAGVQVRTRDEAERAMEVLAGRYPHLSIVATGGDQDQPADLLRTADGRISCFEGKHLESSSTHGTGCAFSSALLANLILGKASYDAVAAAKKYVTEAIRRAPGLGHGRGPLDLLWPMRPAR